MRGVPVGANPTRQLSLQPEAIGAATQERGAEQLFGVEGHVGDLASMRAVTKVNAEQVSKKVMRKPTQPWLWGRLSDGD
jgi:hypothetical protein